MLTKRIIPCLDVTGGRVVKGISFVNLRDAGDPVELAAFYNAQGADELVFLDITASSDNRATLLGVVERTAAQVFIPLTVGGGLRSVEDIRLMLAAGADKTSLNTAAIANPDLIRQGAKKFGSQCIVIAIDAKRRQRAAHPGESLWEVYSHGGRTPTGRDAVVWAKEAVALGAGEILLTSMDADGRKNGYDLELLKQVGATVPVPVIASGGVGSLEHLYQGILSGADAVLAASIFHYGIYSIQQAKTYLAGKGIPMRMPENGENHL